MRTLRDASLLAEHQLVAVERLDRLLSSYGGAILADEPGLGKSFVAAELARRESMRGGAIECVVPASLVRQWEETLARFGVRAAVITHAALLSRAPADEAEPRMKCGERAGVRLLIVDEAHAFRNPATQRYAALARRSVGARLLLVTATPVCNSARDLEALLRLVATDDALVGRGVPSIDLAFERRDRESIDIVVRTLLLRRDRAVVPATLAFGDLDREVIWTRNADDETERNIARLRFPLVSGEPLVRDFLRRRLDSSEAALLESLRRQRRFYERALECLASGRALPKREYRRAFGHEEDAAAVQTILFWELFVDENAGIDPAAIHAALAGIDALVSAVERLPRAKEEKLLRLCRDTNEPIVIFTGWTATARALAAALRTSKRVVVVTGRERSNDASIEAFRRGLADILISTDVGSEGLNLQRAGVVVHYDLPWNPVKVDQRNGRAHRIGQTRRSVRAVYFLSDRHRDAVLATVAAKNRVRRRLLKPTDACADEVQRVTTIRPRVAADAAAIAFAHGLEAAGWRMPAELGRRHRAGLEALLAEIARRPIDAGVLRALESLAAGEPWASSRGLTFTLL